MEILLVITGPRFSDMNESWIKSRGYTLEVTFQKLHILRGIELRPSTENWLRKNGYEVLNTVPSEEDTTLPPISEYVRPAKEKGGYGCKQLLNHVLDHPQVPVFYITKKGQELVVRRLDEKVYIVLQEKNRYAFAMLSSEEFELAMNRGFGNSALSKCKDMFKDISLGYRQALEYIPANDGYDYVYMAQRIGWAWREDI